MGAISRAGNERHGKPRTLGVLWACSPWPLPRWDRTNYLKPVKPIKHLEKPTRWAAWVDRKSTRLNSSHRCISYAVFCLQKKKYGSYLFRLYGTLHGGLPSDAVHLLRLLLRGIDRATSGRRVGTLRPNTTLPNPRRYGEG